MNIKKSFKLIIAFLVIVFLLSGCLSTVKHVTGVAINEGDQVLEVGQTLQLSVTIEPIDATNTVVFWESSNIDKVTIDENGLVEAIAMPGADITVITEDGKFEDTIAISVIPAGSSTSNNTCDPCNSCNTCEPECDPCDPCGDCYNPCECESDT